MKGSLSKLCIKPHIQYFWAYSKHSVLLKPLWRSEQNTVVLERQEGGSWHQRSAGASPPVSEVRLSKVLLGGTCCSEPLGPPAAKWRVSFHNSTPVRRSTLSPGSRRGLVSLSLSPAGRSSAPPPRRRKFVVSGLSRGRPGAHCWCVVRVRSHAEHSSADRTIRAGNDGESPQSHPVPAGLAEGAPPAATAAAVTIGPHRPRSRYPLPFPRRRPSSAAYGRLRAGEKQLMRRPWGHQGHYCSAAQHSSRDPSHLCAPPLSWGPRPAPAPRSAAAGAGSERTAAAGRCRRLAAWRAPGGGGDAKGNGRCRGAAALRGRRGEPREPLPLDIGTRLGLCSCPGLVSPRRCQLAPCLPCPASPFPFSRVAAIGPWASVLSLLPVVPRRGSTRERPMFPALPGWHLRVAGPGARAAVAGGQRGRGQRSPHGSSPPLRACSGFYALGAVAKALSAESLLSASCTVWSTGAVPLRTRSGNAEPSSVAAWRVTALWASEGLVPEVVGTCPLKRSSSA